MDVREKLNADAYKNTMEYPSTPSKVCPECNTSFGGTKEIPNFCHKCGKSVKDDYEARYAAYKEARQLYNEVGAALNDEFKKDALEYFDLTGNPKADKAYSMAWERGHSSGYHDVLSNLEDLSELLLD